MKHGKHDSNGFVIVVIGALLVLLFIAITSMLWPRAAHSVSVSPIAQDRPVMVRDTLYAEDARGNSMRLDSTPCANGKVLMLAELKGIPEGYRKAMQAGLLFYEGKNYDACWVIGPDGAVYVVDSEGDMSRIPMEAFKRRDGA